MSLAGSQCSGENTMIYGIEASLWSLTCIKALFVRKYQWSRLGENWSFDLRFGLTKPLV